MVNFIEPSKYIYGTADFATSCQQGGAYNRDVIGVRVEHVSEVMSKIAKGWATLSSALGYVVEQRPGHRPRQDSTQC